MAKYRMICPKIWNDAKFRVLSDDAKMLFFLLLTHPHTSSIGTLRCYREGLAPDLGWPLERLSKAFREVFGKGMIKADEKAGLIWLPNFIKYNLPASPNVVKSWTGSLDDCPECGLKNEILQSLIKTSESLSKAFRKAFEESFKSLLEDFRNQEQEQEQEQEKEKRHFCPELSCDSSAPEQLSPPSSPPMPPDDSFIELPLNDGTGYHVLKRDMREWQELYPAVNIGQALRNMKGWLLGNPQKRKTKTGIKRFIQNWLAKEQNSPRSPMPTQQHLSCN